MSRFLSKIKARLEPGQQYASEEAGWVRAALESMEQETKDVPIVEALSQGSPSSWQADLVERMRVLALGSGEALTVSNITLPGKVNHGNSSAQSASERLWETGNLDCSLPNGFYSMIPHEHPKVRPPTISTADSEAGLWDILLVDDRQDKTLVKLKEICLELVKGFEANTADTIRKIAGMVADFYGGPLFETGHVKDVALSKEHDSNVTLLGQVKVGLCRPRALLFKYLGDAVGLKNRLLLGLQLDSVPSTSLICSNPKKHLTNVVELNGKELLVDVMHHPGHLRPFTVKALVMYHISGPGDSDSADYDSCDSPLEPNSPVYFGPQERVDAASPSQSEPDLANPSWRHNRRKSISDERGNKSSPEFQSEVRYFQRRHMGDGARSFPSSPEHSQARFRSLRSMRSLGSNPSSPEHTGLRARAPSMLSGSRRTLDEDTERASTSSPDDSPQYQNLTAASFRRRSSSFCVREGGLERAINTSSESRRVRKRTNAPEIGDDVVRAVRAMNEAAKQGRRTTEQEFQGRCAPTETVGNELQLRSNDQDLKERAGSEPNSLKICGSSSSLQSLEGLTVDAARISRDFLRNEIHASGSTVSVSDLLPDRPVMPYREWNIDFSELRIGIRVGIGSFGEVFRGTWRGTEVAVKIMLEQDLTRENTEDFFNEISLLSRLRHPNVILFMGACTKPPHLSMVTEYMHMGSLYRLIHTSGQGKKLSWRRRLKMLRDICRGMMCIQRMNIIHRDLKSANCLVDKHWCVKICDFGLSRLTDGSPIQETTAAGTPEWMAPELLRNEPVSYKCDVFSLGVIMWELCTLKRPWEGVQPLQVVYEVSHKKSRLEVPEGLLGKLISGNVPSASTSIDRVPSLILMRLSLTTDCWQENPQDRPSYDEILTRLHECDFLLG